MRCSRTKKAVLACALCVAFLITSCSATLPIHNMPISPIEYCSSPSEEESEILQLANGAILSRTAFLFDYEVPLDYSEINIYCDIYKNGQKEQDSICVLSLLFHDTLPEYSHSGRILIDVGNLSISATDTFYVMDHYITQEEELSEEMVPTPYIIRRGGTIPDDDSLRSSYQHFVFSSVDGEETAQIANAYNEPIYLLLFAEDQSDDVHLNIHMKSAEEILADNGLLASIDKCYIFYCHFK